MSELGDLGLDEAVDTRGTNWEFVGSVDHPSWENTETEHRIAAFAEDGEYQLKLNHADQLRPWWPITTEDFAAELIPLVEWVISTPDSDLTSREAVSCLLEPFWKQQTNTVEKTEQ